MKVLMNNHKSHQTLIFAHRGANREAADNTRAAFDKALQYPIDGMETDVQLSKDEVCVLWHDRYTDKLGYPDQYIDDFDVEELNAMDFGVQFNLNSQPEGVLSLREFLATYRGRCLLQIEIKNRDWETLERHHIKVKQTLDLLASSNANDVLISSFNLQSMQFSNQLNPNIPVYYAFDETQGISDVESVLEHHPYLTGLCLPIQNLDQRIMDVLRLQHKKMLVYTCNTDTEIHKALNLGVDVLITDDPQKAITMRNSCNGISPA